MSVIDETELKKRLSTIKATIEKIRPFVQRDGGDISFESYDTDTGVVIVNTIGACSGCFIAVDEIAAGIETILQQEIPSITRVELKSEYGIQSGFDPAATFRLVNGIPVIDPLADDIAGEEEEDPLSVREQVLKMQEIDVDIPVDSGVDNSGGIESESGETGAE